MKRFMLFLLLTPMCLPASSAFAQDEGLSAVLFRPWNDARSMMFSRIGAELGSTLMELDAFLIGTACLELNDSDVCARAFDLNRQLTGAAWHLNNLQAEHAYDFEPNRLAFSRLLRAYSAWIGVFGHELHFEVDSSGETGERHSFYSAVTANMLVKYLCLSTMAIVEAFDDGGLGGRGGF